MAAHGLRMALANPDRVEALIVQNAVAHNEGWALLETATSLWADRAAHRTPSRSISVTARDANASCREHPDVIAMTRICGPMNLLFSVRPGQADIQSDMFYDTLPNVESYPKWQD